jgi:hypothetical protein
LKEGKALPAKEIAIVVYRSVVIRGTAARLSSDNRGWFVPSTDEIDNFFGESGRMDAKPLGGAECVRMKC